MDRTACTEPQCLYSRAIPLLPLWTVRPVQSLSACTVQLYLCSPYGPYGLYRASVPVQGCTLPPCLYSWQKCGIFQIKSISISQVVCINSYTAVAPMSVRKYEQLVLPNCTAAMGSEITERPEKKIFEPSTTSFKTYSTHIFTNLLPLNQREKKKGVGKCNVFHYGLLPVYMKFSRKAIST